MRKWFFFQDISLVANAVGHHGAWWQLGSAARGLGCSWDQLSCQLEMRSGRVFKLSHGQREGNWEGKSNFLWSPVLSHAVILGVLESRAAPG